MYLSKQSETINIEAAAYYVPYVIRCFADLLVIDAVKYVKSHPEERGSIVLRKTVT
jgi:hypothetical protein